MEIEEDSLKSLIDVNSFQHRCETFTKSLSNIYSELFIDIQTYRDKYKLYVIHIYIYIYIQLNIYIYAYKYIDI